MSTLSPPAVEPAGGLSPDELAFVRGIAADPADLLLRNAYADWLEDRGDPRGEFLRLVTRYREEEARFSRDRPAIRGRLEQLRSHLPAAWRAMFDRAGRFYTCWRAGLRDRLRAAGGRAVLRAVATAAARPPGPRVGDYWYFLTVSDGRPALVARGRVRHVETRSGTVLARTAEVTVIPPVPVPLDAIRFRTERRRKELGLGTAVGGRVTNLGAFANCSELTADTALRFEAVLSGWAGFEQRSLTG